jgi:hypothetical protein
MTTSIADRRLLNQGLADPRHRRPADVIAWSGAVQGQEYEPAKWGLGLRMVDNTVNAAIESAFESGQILRTHVMRPTWHFVAAADIRWLQALTGPRVQRTMSNYNRQVGLDARTVTRATAVIERSLRDGQHLTRAELSDRLGRAKLDMTGIRLAHAVMHAELECLICSGPRRGKQFTYALVAERAPVTPKLARDEALGELTRRYFRSHGPATVRDFVWWSGLPTAEAKRGVEIVKARHEEVDGRVYWSVDGAPAGRRRERLVHLLPIYDEYLVAYRDRDAVPHISAALAVEPTLGWRGNFQHALVVDGQVAGTWRTARTVKGIAVDIIPLRGLTKHERNAIDEATDRYRCFQDCPVEVSVTGGSRSTKPRRTR